MAEREPVPIPDDPLEWAPMRAYDGRRTFSITDPIVEPLWSGTRVLAHVTVTPEDDPAAEVHLIGPPLLAAERSNQARDDPGRTFQDVLRAGEVGIPQLELDQHLPGGDREHHVTSEAVVLEKSDEVFQRGVEIRPRRHDVADQAQPLGPVVVSEQQGDVRSLGDARGEIE